MTEIGDRDIDRDREEIKEQMNERRKLSRGAPKLSEEMILNRSLSAVVDPDQGRKSPGEHLVG
jgi:hypothetical protein